MIPGTETVTMISDNLVTDPVVTYTHTPRANPVSPVPSKETN